MRFLSLQSLQLVTCDKQHILVSNLFSDTVVSFLLSFCGEVSRVGRKLSLQHCTQTHTIATPILMHSHSFSAPTFPHCFPAGRWLVSSSSTGLGRAVWHRSARKSLALRGQAGMLCLLLSFLCFSHGAHQLLWVWLLQDFIYLLLLHFSFLQCFYFQLIHGK